MTPLKKQVRILLQFIQLIILIAMITNVKASFAAITLQGWLFIIHCIRFRIALYQYSSIRTAFFHIQNASVIVQTTDA